MPPSVRTVPEEELAVGAGPGHRPRRRRHDPARAQARHRARGAGAGRQPRAARVPGRGQPRRAAGRAGPDRPRRALDRGARGDDRHRHVLPDAASRAFNDSALSRVPGNGPAALAVEVEDEIFARYTADALVIATPTGSTAYSFAAGGPIVSPRHRGLLVTPVAPHAAFDRAVFLHPSESLRVHVLDRSAPLLLEADGQRVAELNAGDCIEFAMSDAPGADPAPAAAGLLRARAAQAAAHRLLRARPASEPARASSGAAGRLPAPVDAPHRARAGRGDRRSAASVVADAAARRARGGAGRPARPAGAGLRLHAADRGSDRRVPARRVRRSTCCTWAAARARCRATWRRRGRARASSCSSSTRASWRWRARISGCARRRGCGSRSATRRS